MKYDIVIIGGGPAGLTAGLYAGRAGKKTAIISGVFTGGKAALTEKIENYSGYMSIDGFTLTYTMRQQAENAGAEIIEGEVASLDLLSEEKKVTLMDGTELFAGAVILAMGTNNKKLGVAGEDELTGRGVSYCATCDGGFFKNKRVVVNGGGNTAVTDALYLKNIAKEVSIIHRRGEFRAAKVLVDRLYQSGVNIVLNSVITALQGEPLSSVIVKNVLTGEEKEILADGLFVAIGASPNNSLIQGVVNLNEHGYVVTDHRMRTNIKGVFAAGDIRDTPLRQVITACADGAIAAESAIEMSH